MTTSTIFQQSPYLREQRQFPDEDVQTLANQMDQTYIDIASKVNNRTIGIHPVAFPAITGEAWFLKGQPQKQQTMRQVYLFSSTGNIPHGIKASSLDRFTNCYGSYTDGTNFYGVIFASSVAIVGQVSFFITPTNIVVIAGAGAPPIVSGTIVLTWLAPF